MSTIHDPARTRFADVNAIVYELESESPDGISIRVSPETDRQTGLVEIPQMDVNFAELRKLIQFFIDIDAEHGKCQDSVTG